MKAVAAVERRHEGMVCVALAALVYLSRGNPDLVYPDILHLVLLLLGLNLASAAALRRWPGRPSVSALFTMANAAVVAGLVEKSGAERSLLWVLYLLPIYSAGVGLAERHLALVLAGALAFCLVPLSLADGEIGEVLAFAAAVKSIVLVMTAWAVAHSMRRERRHREGASRQRASLLGMEASLAVQEARVDAAERLAGATLDVAGVVHDARTPLTVIQTSVDYIADDAPEALRPHLERIRRASRLAEHILVQALEQCRQAPPDAVPTDLGSLLDSAARLCDTEARMRHIALEVDLPGSLPRVPVDPMSVERVFLNLIKNAAEALRPGGRITAGVEVVKDAAGRPFSIRCRVEDDGPGLPPGFRLGDAGRSGKAGGTGLGLAASLRTVLRYGGSLWAEDRPEGGARFIVEFPVAAGAAAAAAAVRA
ncbi:MAG: sensor histidine kinase/response regulator [Elusimicrobia bacterium]|nr:MAG: sensor histidine kinase/response regulator [Elusimicrobiota bacterium]